MAKSPFYLVRTDNYYRACGRSGAPFVYQAQESLRLAETAAISEYERINKTMRIYEVRLVATVSAAKPAVTYVESEFGESVPWPFPPRSQG